jgi:hypothetical protein
MRPFWSDPLSTFCDAVRSAVGWLLVVFGVSVLGSWLGIWIGLGEPPGLGGLVTAPLMLFFAPRSHPELLVVLLALTIVLWYVPHRFESLWLYLGGAVADFLAWLAFWAWALG